MSMAAHSTESASATATATDAGRDSAATAAVESSAGAGLTKAMVEKLSPEQLYGILKQRATPLPITEEVPAVATVVPVASFIMAFAIVAVALYTGLRKERQRQETLRVFLEKGMPIPSEFLTPKAPRSDLRRGIILIATGVGLSIMFGVLAEPRVASIGALPGLIGVGFLVASKLERRSESAGSLKS
jgi:hypothetical protein